MCPALFPEVDLRSDYISGHIDFSDINKQRTVHTCYIIYLPEMQNFTFIILPWLVVFLGKRLEKANQKH